EEVKPIIPVPQRPESSRQAAIGSTGGCRRGKSIGLQFGIGIGVRDVGLGSSIGGHELKLASPLPGSRAVWRVALRVALLGCLWSPSLAIEHGRGSQAGAHLTVYRSSISARPAATICGPVT